MGQACKQPPRRESDRDGIGRWPSRRVDRRPRLRGGCGADTPRDRRGVPTRGQAGARLRPCVARRRRCTGNASLEYRQRDDSQRRHAGVLALYDWCWGGDDQWLYCETDDRKLYSHDHGWYLPEVGPDWSEASLLGHVDTPHTLHGPSNDLDQTALRQLAERLEPVTREELAAMLQGVPVSWSASDAELEALGFFLERRARSRGQTEGRDGRKLMRFVYSIVRFVPDPARGEFVSVGAIVGSEESSEWQYRQVENPARARALDERQTLDAVWSFLDRVGRQIDDYERRLRTSRRDAIQPRSRAVGGMDRTALPRSPEPGSAKSTFAHGRLQRGRSDGPDIRGPRRRSGPETTPIPEEAHGPRGCPRCVPSTFRREDEEPQRACKP